MKRFPISTSLSRVSGAAFGLFVFLGSDNLPQPTDRNRLLIWKLSYKRQASSYGFHKIPQGGKQQVTSFLQTRDSFLSYIECPCHGFLCFVDRLPEFSQRHFPRDQFTGASLNLCPPLWTDLRKFFL